MLKTARVADLGKVIESRPGGGLRKDGSETAHTGLLSAFRATSEFLSKHYSFKGVKSTVIFYKIMKRFLE